MTILNCDMNYFKNRESVK